MTWKKIEQKEKYLSSDGGNYQLKFGAVYKDYLVTFKKKIHLYRNALCFLDLRICFFLLFFTFSETKNTWSSFDIKGIDKKHRYCFEITGNLMIYNHLLVAAIAEGTDLFVATLNLESKISFEKFVCFYLKRLWSFCS